MTPRVDRRPVVAVIGSGHAPHIERSRPLGTWLAGRGTHLLTGGGGGVMVAVTEAFTRVAPRLGTALGILPSDGSSAPAPPAGYPNPWIEVPILTHLPLRGEAGADERSRNHVVVLSADLVVALPGSAGTASEIELAGRYGRPLIIWADADTFVGASAPLARSLDEVTAFLDKHLPPKHTLVPTAATASNDRDEEGDDPDDNRRRHRRIACDGVGLKAGFKLESGAIGHFRVAARNISVSGLAFVHPQPVSIGESCQLLLPGAGGAEVIGVTAVVRHCRRVGLALNEIAVEFDVALADDVLAEVLVETRSGR
jgi:uncharacterized protein (TIGR00725 family)